MAVADGGSRELTWKAVYQTIERLRRQGALPETYNPSCQPPRRPAETGGASIASPGIAPRESALATLRELAGGADSAEGAYAAAIEGAISGGDAVGLAYELGRLDAGGDRGLPLDLVESALRRLAVLPSQRDEQK